MFESKLRIERNWKLKFIYESPDNGKTVYQRPLGSNIRIKIKGDDAVGVEEIVTESGNVIMYYTGKELKKDAT
jgi:hypothetical protein